MRHKNIGRRRSCFADVYCTDVHETRFFRTYIRDICPDFINKTYANNCVRARVKFDDTSIYQTLFFIFFFFVYVRNKIFAQHIDFRKIFISIWAHIDMCTQSTRVSKEQITRIHIFANISADKVPRRVCRALQLVVLFDVERMIPDGWRECLYLPRGKSSMG